MIDIPDDELLRRAVKSCEQKGQLRWSTVSERFALGSTYSAQLCLRFGIDPDEKGKKNV